MLRLEFASKFLAHLLLQDPIHLSTWLFSQRISWYPYYFWNPDIILHDSFHPLELRTHIGTCSNRRDGFGQRSWAVGISQEPIPDRICAFSFATFLELWDGDAEVTIKILCISITRMRYLPHRTVAEMSPQGPVKYSVLKKLAVQLYQQSQDGSCLL